MSEKVPPAQGKRGDYSMLFSPFCIREVELRNRIVFQPHFTALGTLDGRPTERQVAYHEERARGGVGLIVIESQAVHPTGKMARRFINAWDPSGHSRLRKITDAVHEHGAKIFGQLTHGGHTSLQQPPGIMWAPTQMPEPSSDSSTKAMDLADIAATVSRASPSSAATPARPASTVSRSRSPMTGCSARFASPFFNHRTDRYGGSFENRMRSRVEVVEAIKKRSAAPTFPSASASASMNTRPGATASTTASKMARSLEATGCVDYFNCDAGSFSSFWMEIPPMAVPGRTSRPQCRAEEAAAACRSSPSVASRPPQRAEECSRAGEADLIGWARQLIADPETPNKLGGQAGPISFAPASPATMPASIRSVRTSGSAASTIPTPAESSSSTSGW